MRSNPCELDPWFCHRQTPLPSVTWYSFLTIFVLPFLTCEVTLLVVPFAHHMCHKGFNNCSLLRLLLYFFNDGYYIRRWCFIIDQEAVILKLKMVLSLDFLDFILLHWWYMCSGQQEAILNPSGSPVTSTQAKEQESIQKTDDKIGVDHSLL